MANDQKLNLTEKEVAATRGIGLRQLRSMRMRGNGPKWFKISGKIGQTGGRVVYPAAALDEWLRNCPGGGDQIRIHGKEVSK